MKDWSTDMVRLEQLPRLIGDALRARQLEVAYAYLEEMKGIIVELQAYIRSV